MTCMRRFSSIPIVLLTACSLNAMAQNSSDDKVIWGIKGAVDINVPGKWHVNDVSQKMFRHGLGGTLGAVCNIYLGHDFYLEPGVSIFYDTYSYSDFIVITDRIEGNIDFDARIHKIGIRVPVVVGYTFDVLEMFNLNLFTGPELSYAFSGGIDDKYKNLISAEDLSLFEPFGDFGLHRRVDCAWKIGMGIPTEYATITIEGVIGMTDIYKGDWSMKENRVTIGLTHYF